MMEGKGDMSEQAIVSEAMNPVVRKSQEGAGTLKEKLSGFFDENVIEVV